MRRLAEWAAGIAALSISATAARAQPQPDLSRVVPGVPAAEMRRFLAASTVALAQDGSILAYDFATQCALVLPQNRPDADPYLAAGAAPAGEVTAITLADAGTENITRFRGSTPAADASCVDRVRAAYGGSFEAAARNGALARHALSVAQGAALDGPDSTLSAASRERTRAAQERARGLFRSPVLLGAVVTDARTILIVGDAGGSYRWFVGYRNLPNGAWEFEGAEDGGILYQRR